MTTPTTPRPGRAGLALRALILLLPLFGALVQSSCWVYVDDCDDDDDYCYDDDDDDDFDDDDDDDFHLTPGGGGPATAGDGGASPLPAADAGLRLVTYRLLESDEPGAHPVRRLVGIEGIAMRAAPEAATGGDGAFAEFTKLVLFENWDLIGLPASAGVLVFDGTSRLDGETRVRYAQRPSPLGVLSGFDGGTGAGLAMTFVLDGQGKLVEIDNATRVAFD